MAGGAIRQKGGTSVVKDMKLGVIVSLVMLASCQAPGNSKTFLRAQTSNSQTLVSFPAGDWSEYDLEDVSAKHSVLNTIGFYNSSAYFRTHEPISKNVVIGVIDEGVVNPEHPDYEGRVTLVPGADKKMTRSRHGQDVVGLIAASAHNGMGVDGVAGDFTKTIYSPIRDFSGTELAAAVEDLIRRRVDIIHISMAAAMRGRRIEGVYYPLATIPPFLDLFNKAIEHNIVVTISAGNSGMRVDDMSGVPGGLFVVGSVNEDRTRVENSNYGNLVNFLVDLSGGVYTLSLKGSKKVVRRETGTSHALSIAVGAIAHAIGYLKTRDVQYSPGDIEELILQSSDIEPQLKAVSRYGAVVNYANLPAVLKRFADTADVRKRAVVLN